MLLLSGPAPHTGPAPLWGCLGPTHRPRPTVGLQAALQPLEVSRPVQCCWAGEQCPRLF